MDSIGHVLERAFLLRCARRRAGETDALDASSIATSGRVKMKRYNLEVTEDGTESGYRFMDQAANGEWVKYEDIEPLSNSDAGMHLRWALGALDLALNGLRNRRGLVLGRRPSEGDPEMWNLNAAKVSIEAALKGEPYAAGERK